VPGASVGSCRLLATGFLLWAGAVTGYGNWHPAAAQTADFQNRHLKAGETVRGLLTSTEERFEISLESGTFLRISVLAETTLEVRLTDPDGLELVRSPVAPDSEVPVSTVSGRAGPFVLRIGTAARPAGTGYRLRVRQLRPALPNDATRVAADRLVLGASVRDIEAARGLYQDVGDGEDAVRAQIRIGRLHLAAEDFARASEVLQTALRLSRELGDALLEAAALESISAVYVYQGKSGEASAACAATLRLARAAGDAWLEARALVAMGDAQYSNAQLKESLKSYLKAADSWSRLEWRTGQAEALLNAGFAYMDLGEDTKALPVLTSAEALWRALGDNGNTAETLRALGVLHSRLDEKQKALDYFFRAQELLPAAGQKRQRALIANAIGWVYFDLGELPVAERQFQQALEMVRAIGYPLAEGAYLHELGLVAFARRDYARARENYQASLTTFRQLGNRRWISLLTLELGLVLLAEGKAAEALEALDGALASIREHTGPYTEAKCLDAIGRASQALKNYDRAAEAYEEALRILQAGRYRYREAQTRLQLAKLERDRGNLAEARRQAEAALRAIETVRMDAPGPEFRASYFSSTHDYFEFNTDLLMELHRANPTDASLDASAFWVTERGRARSLLDSLAEARVEIREGVDPALLQRETELKRRLNRAAARQSEPSGDSKKEQESLAAEVRDLTIEYQQVKALIQTRSPKYAALTQPQPLTLAQVQQQLLDGDTVLLEYSLGEEASYLWAVGANSYHSYRLPPRDRIEAAALRLRNLLTAYETPADSTTRERRLRIRESESRYWIEAAALSEILLGPVASQIAGKRLLIVPDGALNSLPFAALPAPKRPAGASPIPLVVEHELVLLPSASILAVLRSQAAGRTKASKWIAVLADPVLDAQDPRLPKALPARPDSAGGIVYRRLPSTRIEAEAITKLAPPGGAMTALGFEANRRLASDGSLGEYRVVHFATHVTAHYEQPELSGVVLSKFDKGGQAQEGLLRLHDIYNLRLPADLVVLSACESYLGKQVRGEGLLGIVRGFMYAGANRVMASMWKVDDFATKELMVRFYRNMFTHGESPAAALRHAQIEMWREPDWHAPYYWAAFVLQGEWK
jgi:CHAT domain-containing protein